MAKADNAKTEKRRKASPPLKASSAVAAKASKALSRALSKASAKAPSKASSKASSRAPSRALSKESPKTLSTEIGRAVRAAEDKQAEDLVVLDLRKAAGFTDCFVICTGGNARQIRAIADGVMEALAVDGTKPAHIEGYQRSEWILIDYFDFIVHVFARETRLFYSLERLWGDAENVET